MNNLSKYKSFSRRVLLWLVISIQSMFLPLSLTAPFVRAQEAPTESVSEITPVIPIVEEQTKIINNSVNPQEPAESEESAYSFNVETGLWENDYYTWDPATNLTLPKVASRYTYNIETGEWGIKGQNYTSQITTEIESNPQTDQANTNTTYNKLQPTTSEVNNSTASPSLLEKTTSSSLLNNMDTLDGQGDLSVTDYDSSNNGYLDIILDANADVSVYSNAVSGNASVLQNTIGGSALTGDASAMATIINLVQSAWGIGGLMPHMYTENIQGDYFGDIFLNPSLLNVQPVATTSELVVNSTQDVAIVNDIELVAQSGNALLQANTQAGDAKTGDATAILNLMNVINSSMSAGQSFIGMLNIFGNLEGDVLIPENLIDSLIASNIPTTNIQLPQDLETNLAIDNNNEQTINNDISAVASSGDAKVSYNTSAGNALSGDASTNVTVFNLTGSRIIADKALLVFVQVMGKWIGFITNAPNGSNVALLGGGVGKNQKIYDAEVNSNNTSLIDNNVSVSAMTGDASVLQNTTAGDAITGNANAVANIANITNSSLSLSNWFGVLFINIFGNWSGSFGTNTPFGSLLNAVSNPSNNNAPQAVTDTVNTSLLGAEPSSRNVRVFTVKTGANSSGGISVTSATPVMEEDVPPPTVLNDSDSKKGIATISNNSNNKTPSSGLNSFIWVSLISLLIAGIVYRRVQLS